MATIPFLKYKGLEDVGQLVSQLNNDYYEALAVSCMSAGSVAQQLTQQNYQLIQLYTSLSTKLTEEVADLLNHRQNILMPYIKDLLGKREEGHDCRNCSGGCHVQHTIYMQGMKDVYKRIKEMLFRLHNIALPLYTEIEYPAQYKVLRNEILLIDTMLTELFYLEEACLVPGVLAAQRSIHA